MTSWVADPIASDRRRRRRSAMVRVLAVMVASLIMANGVIITENATGWDLSAFLKDGVRDARSALSRMLESDDGKAAAPKGHIEETTSTTGATTTTTGASTTTTTGVSSTTEPPATSPTTARAVAPPVTKPQTAMSVADRNNAVLSQLRAFVERERGLSYTGPVTVVSLADGPFRSRLAAYRLAPATAAAKQIEGVLKTLGVIEPGTDIVAQMNRLSIGSATSFYDAAANELVIRGDVTAPFARKVLVHELTNALEDQHFELDRPALRNADDESYQAYDALVDGIASRIEDRYFSALPEADRNAITAEQQRLAAQFPKDLPQYVLVSFGFPFTAGLRFANALFGQGGAARLNTAMQQPPTTTEQVLHPDKYTAGEGARAVPAPPSDGAVIRQGTLGQLTLSLMFAQVLDASYAESAVDGWAGDRYVAWQNGSQTCVRLSIEMDNPGENQEMAEALADWAGDRPGATVEGQGPFTVTRCA